MRKRIIFLYMCVCLVLSLSACSYKSDKKISEKELNSRKTAYEEYLKKAYPDKTFTVDVWQEYRKVTGGAGLPDYEGYTIRWVITDKNGNRFKIWGDSKDSYYDDYKKVLDGDIYYNEKGEHVYFDENGNVKFVSDY